MLYRAHFFFVGFVPGQRFN